LVPNAPVVPALLVGLAVLLGGSHGLAEPRHYDPDQQACQVEMIRNSFRANLLPWQDQPEPVQQRLLLLQKAMTVDTLRACQARGLLSPAQVHSLAVELALPSPSGAIEAAPVPAQSPTRP
jgi:hypothetical protein